jgi:hypothetical protein
MGRVSIAGCVAAAAVFAQLSYGQNPTLRQAISATHMPIASLHNPYLDTRITSWGWGCERGDYVIAYYFWGGKMFGDALVGPLQLAEYHAAQRRWTEAQLTAPPRPKDAMWSRFDSAPGLGSVLSAAFEGPYIYLNLHYTPSATMTVQLSRDLKPLGSFYGWPLGHLSNGSMIYQNSMVNFAATHAAKLSIFDPKTKSSVLLFPLKPDGPARAAHLKALVAAYEQIGRDWFRESKYPPDPEAGDADLVVWQVNPKTNAAAFVVNYSFFHPGVKLSKNPALDITAIYVYRYLDEPARMQWKELPAPGPRGSITDATLARYTTRDGLNQVFENGTRDAI